MSDFDAPDGRTYSGPVTAATPGSDDPFGGHEFAYESHTDLFRCVRCHTYEVSARKGPVPGEFEPCTGEPPAGAEPIEVDAW